MVGEHVCSPNDDAWRLIIVAGHVKSDN